MADFIPSTTQGTPGPGDKPTGQAPASEGAEGQRQGQSSIQKLKTRLQDSLRAQEYYKQRDETHEAEITSLRQDIDSLKRMRDPQGPEDYSEHELLNAALSPEMEQPKALKAFMHYMEKKLNNLEKAISGSVEDRVQDHFRNRDRQMSYATELQKLKAKYGEDNLIPGSDLHTRASQYFEAMREQVADGDGVIPDNVKQLVQIRAVEMAAEDLGMNTRKPEQSAPEGVQPSMEDRLEAGSDAAVTEHVNKAEELIKRGDWKGAIHERLRARFGVK